MISPIKVLGSIVYRTRESLIKDKKFLNGLNVYFQYFPENEFKLWHYPGTPNEISNTLLELSKTSEGNKYKFPALFNFHPIEQYMNGQNALFTYNLAFVARTLSSWTTEEREQYVFIPVLRPIYEEFFKQIRRSGYFMTGYSSDFITHRMYEVYTTGNNQDELIKGRYSDYVDAIEVHSLALNLNRLCDGEIQLIEEQNNLIS